MKKDRLVGAVVGTTLVAGSLLLGRSAQSQPTLQGLDPRVTVTELPTAFAIDPNYGPVTIYYINFTGKRSDVNASVVLQTANKYIDQTPNMRYYNLATKQTSTTFIQELDYALPN